MTIPNPSEIMFFEPRTGKDVIKGIPNHIFQKIYILYTLEENLRILFKIGLN